MIELELFAAAERGDVATIKRIHENNKNVDFNFKDSSGYTPLTISIKNGRTDAARLLLSYAEVDINKRALIGYSPGSTPLVLSIIYNRIEIFQELLHKGADVNALHASRVTALIVAAAQGRKIMVEQLITHNAHINDATEDGRTALQAAYKGHHHEIVSLLKNKGGVISNPPTSVEKALPLLLPGNLAPSSHRRFTTTASTSQMSMSHNPHSMRTAGTINSTRSTVYPPKSMQRQAPKPVNTIGKDNTENYKTLIRQIELLKEQLKSDEEVIKSLKEDVEQLKAQIKTQPLEKSDLLPSFKELVESTKTTAAPSELINLRRDSFFPRRLVTREELPSTANANPPKI